MSYRGIRVFAVVLCMAAVGCCQSSNGQTQGFQSGQSLKQAQPKAVTPPAPNGSSRFSPDSSMCSPTSADAATRSQKSSDPHAKPPSSLPATTAPGSTTSCVGTSGTENSPAEAKQAEPRTGPTPAKPLPNRQNNSPSPFDLTNQINVASSVPGGPVPSPDRFADRALARRI